MTLLKLLILISCVSVGLARIGHPRTRGDYSLPDLISADDEFDQLKQQHSSKEGVNERNPLEEEFRLPRNVIPFHYALQITTDVHQGNRAFSGKVELHFKVTNVSETVYVHSRGLNLTKSELYSFAGNGSEIDRVFVESLNYTSDQEKEFIIFTAEERMVPTQSYILSIEYRGNLRTDFDGLYLGSYENDQGVRRYFASTQFQPISARTALPCFDEPALKATVDLTIIHHRLYTAVSNMHGVRTGSDDYVVTTFDRTPVMSIYLLAFLVSDFEYRQNSTQRVFARPNAFEETEFALLAGTKTLSAMDDYIGIPYSKYMPKLDQVAIQGFDAGAMENWGLCKYGEPYLLYTPLISTFRQRTWISTIIAHEYIHQWFGNVVTNEWWSFLWLNEGFATLYEYYGAQLAFPENEFFEMFNSDVVQWALDADSREGTRPMSYSRGADLYQIWSLFDNIAYSKAGSVLNMFRNVLGESAWQAMIQIYLTDNALKPVNPGHLVRAMELAVNSSYILPGNILIRNFVNSWSDQAGYPVLDVRRNYRLREVILSQDRFYNNKIVTDDPTIWIIPYNIAVQTAPNFNNLTWSWLADRAVRLPMNISDNNWIILNKQQTGFYRVNYDVQNWYLIIDTLYMNHTTVHRLNRAQLLDDAFQLARSNRLDMEVVLDMMVYLRNETEYHPWTAASPILSYFYNRLRGTGNYQNYQRFVASLIDGVYSNLTIDAVSTNESHLDRYLKQTISTWACTIGVVDCLNRTQILLQQTAEANGYMHPDIAAVTHCFGLRNATSVAFMHLYNRLKASTNQVQRNMLIDALGCSGDTEALNSFLMTSIGGDLQVNYTMSERNRVLYSVAAGSRDGVDALIDFLVEVHDYVYDIFGQGGLNSAVANIASKTNNREEMDRLEYLLDELGSAVPTSVAQAALQVATRNLEWPSTREGLIVASFLNNYS
ncbi:aminopeptidase N-like [Topomyia yanbarensis]|uniref:aminopeptidase N-like n=1 Tax=Topomyia yanbarensis TaxID=2498891 RepID=UPI00273C58B8|nr:aminopeptidase N-like [Topomyia yanbarensis]